MSFDATGKLANWLHDQRAKTASVSIENQQAVCRLLPAPFKKTRDMLMDKKPL
jgi:hypothetical protein